MRGFTIWFTGAPGTPRQRLLDELEGTLLEHGLQVERVEGGGPGDSSSLVERCLRLNQERVIALISGLAERRPEGALRSLEVCELELSEATASPRGSAQVRVAARPGGLKLLIVTSDVDAAVPRIVRELERAGLIPESRSLEFSDEQERVLTQRLKDLGYI